MGIMGWLITQRENKSKKIVGEISKDNTFEGLNEREKKKVSDLVDLVGTPASLYEDLMRPLLARPLGSEDLSKKRVELIKQIIIGLKN